ncbi:hypothetical protein GN156_15005 [bacterium LRH843]|nr:hypothetical protein [bacterium LRH843]
MKNRSIHDSKLMNRIVKDSAEKLYGEEALQSLDKLAISDDFAYFSEKVPGHYAFIGIRNEELGCVYDHHHERFKG